MTTVARTAPATHRVRLLKGRLGELLPVLAWSYGAVAIGLLIPVLARLRWGIPTEHSLPMT